MVDMVVYEHEWEHPVTLELLEHQYDPTYGDGDPVPVTVAICPACSALVHHLYNHRLAMHGETLADRQH